MNQILNETSPDLRQRERLVGSAAFQGGYSPTLSMIPDFNPNAASTQQSMVEDTSFLNNMPSIPISPAPILVEGRESTHVPLSALPEGISALDAVKYIPAAPEVKQALTRNYSQMMKLIDKKRGKV